MPIEKARLVNLDTNEVLQVMFNPDQIEISKEIFWKESLLRHTHYPLSEFHGVSPRKMKLSLFFDTYESRMNVNDLFINRLNQFSDFLPEVQRPPRLQFIWGTFIFPCIIRKMITRFLMFLPDGTPVRAVTHVLFQEFVQEEVRETRDSDTLFEEEVHVTGEGESLPDIAVKYYGDSSQWRIIANYNGIQDPIHLASGLTLKIPKIQKERDNL
jgi:hypothetical protein